MVLGANCLYQDNRLTVLLVFAIQGKKGEKFQVRSVQDTLLLYDVPSWKHSGDRQHETRSRVNGT